MSNVIILAEYRKAKEIAKWREGLSATELANWPFITEEEWNSAGYEVEFFDLED